MKHEQLVDASEYRSSPHPMASREWAQTWALPIVLGTIVAMIGLFALVGYVLTHWDTAVQWVEVGVFALAVLLALRLYFYFHGKYHYTRMHDIAAREREVDLRLKRAHAKLLEEATANRANVRVHETGALEVTYLPAPVRVSEVVTPQQIVLPQLPPPPVTITPVPTGRELLMSGDVNRALAEGLIILGLGADGKLKTLRIKRCFSTLVSGLPSSGKTTTVFWIVSQLTLIGAKLWIIDPHMHFEDEDGNKSLAAELSDMADSFVFDPCDGEPTQVVDRVKWMYGQLRIRQQPGYIVRAENTVIGIMDEFNTIADSIDPKLVIVQHNGRDLNFSSTLALLEREGRKYGLHFILIGHKWTQRDIGGDNALRTNATTYMCHRMNDKHQAELLIAGGGKEVLALHSGSYWITGISWNGEPARITTPMISAADIPLLLQVKRRGLVEVVNMNNVVDADRVPHPFPSGSQVVPVSDDKLYNEHGRNVDEKRSELDSVKLALMRQMVQEHKSQSDIIAELFSGMRKADAIAEYRTYLADLLHA